MEHQTRGIVASSGVALAALTGLVALTTPATAAPSAFESDQEVAAGDSAPTDIRDCGPDVVCMWEDDYETGSMYVKQGGAGRFEIDDWNGDNEISSVANHTPCTLRLWGNDGWAGTYHDVPPYGVFHSLGDWDNVTESFEVLC